MLFSRLFKKTGKRLDDDPRVSVTESISPDDFVRVNDQTFEYRKRVHPDSLTVEFWEDSGLMDHILSCGVMKSEILDVGCGSGEIDIVLAKRGYCVTGIDISPVAVGLAEEHRKRYPDLRDRLTFMVHDMESGPLPQKYSSALFSHTLEHILNPDTTMRNIVASLSRGSYIYVSVPLRKAWNDRTHLRHFSPRSLGRFLADYSTEVDISVDREEKMIFATVRV